MNNSSRRSFLATTTRALLAGTALAAGRLPTVHGATAEVPDDAGWTPLFNGRDLTGWVPVNVAPGTFFVRDNMIVTTGVPMGIMRTDRHYENFILELEWRHMVERGNAGLFVYSDPLPAPGVPFSKSIEIQILDGDSPEGLWTGHGDIFSIHGARMIPDRPHPKGWERCLPSERRAHPFGQWNHYRVESRAGRLTLAVNGKVVSGASECRPRKGYLCLEAEGSECHFRNLRIRTLPTSNPPPDQIASRDVDFRSLYTGVDLHGWAASPDHQPHWQPRDWILASAGTGPDTLPSTETWTDAEFIVDWRIQGGGSAGWIPRGAPTHEVRLESASNRWTRTHLTLRGDLLTVAHGDETPTQRRLPGVPRVGFVALRHHDRPVQFANLFVRPLEA
jgi:hypothetical protein